MRLLACSDVLSGNLIFKRASRPSQYSQVVAALPLVAATHSLTRLPGLPIYPSSQSGEGASLPGLKGDQVRNSCSAHQVRAP